VIAVETDRGIGPLAADLRAAEDGQAEIGEEGDRLVQSRTVMPTFSSLIVMDATVPGTPSPGSEVCALQRRAYRRSAEGVPCILSNRTIRPRDTSTSPSRAA